jgi:hypothetical protein
MLKLLNVGDLVADAVSLEKGSESRQILRMFMNTLIWGGIGVAVVLLIVL